MDNSINNDSLIELLAGVRNVYQPKEVHDYNYYSKYVGLGVHRSGFYGRISGTTVIPLELTEFVFHSKEDVLLVIEGRVDLKATPTNTGIGNLYLTGYGFLVVNGTVTYDGRLSSTGDVTKSYVDLNDALTLQAAKDYTDSKTGVVGILPYENLTYNSGWDNGDVLEGVVNTMFLLQNGDASENLIITPPSTSSVNGAIFGVKDGGVGIAGNAVLSGFSGVFGNYQFVKSGETIIFRCFDNVWTVLTRYNKNFSTNNTFAGLSDVSFTSLNNKNLPWFELSTGLWKNATIEDILGYTPESTGNKVTSLNSPNDTDFPTTNAVKTYVDNAVVGLLNDRGSYDPISGQYPTTGGSGVGGAVRKGDIWYISATGTINGISVTAGSSVRAIANSPGQSDANWDILDVGLGYIPENIANKTTSIVGNEADVTKYTTAKAVFDYFDVFDAASLIPRFDLKANIASPTLTGIPRAPTATYGGAESNTTQIATTAFVTSAISAIPSYTGTSNRITVAAGVIDIASTYVGQTSITTLGTIGTGVWQGTAIADAYIASAATWNGKFSTPSGLNTNNITKWNGTTFVNSPLSSTSSDVTSTNAKIVVNSSSTNGTVYQEWINSSSTLSMYYTSGVVWNWFSNTAKFVWESATSMQWALTNNGEFSWGNGSGRVLTVKTQDSATSMIVRNSLAVGEGSGVPVNANTACSLDLQSTSKGLGLNLVAGNLGTTRNGLLWYDSTANVYKGIVNSTVETFLTVGALVTSSAATLTLSHRVDYVFTGTTTTWTLPAVNASVTGRANAIIIKNRGTGNITLNTNGGSSVLFTSSLVNTLTISVGDSVTLISDGTYFNVI